MHETRHDRFFAAYALAGRLHLRDTGDHGTWDPTRLRYEDEQFVDIIINRMLTRKVRTVEELDETLGSSRDRPGSIDLYVHESLLDETRLRWEEMKRTLPR